MIGRRISRLKDVLAGAMLLATLVPPAAGTAEPAPTPMEPQGVGDASDPVEPERTRYDQVRRDIERAGRAGSVGDLRNLVLDIDRELEEPAPMPVTACWQHLKATALVELDRHEEAEATFRLIMDTCPVWEAENNLAVLEAAAGEFGRAQKRLDEARKKAEADTGGSLAPGEEQRRKIPERNLANLHGEEEEPFLILTGLIGECAGKETPEAYCLAENSQSAQGSAAPTEMARVRATTTLADGAEPIAARFAVFDATDLSGTRGPVAESAGPQTRFEAAVPAGTYVVAAAVGKAFAQQEITVGAGDSSSLSLAMNAGRISSSWRLAPETEPEPARFEVLRDGETVADSEEPVTSFSVIVPAGDYQVRASRGVLASSVRRTVTPGAEMEIALESGVSAALEAWRHAWSVGDVEAFLRSYQEEFSPATEISSAAWAADRRRKIRNKATIAVEVSDVRYSLAAPDQVAVRFTQDYQSTPSDPARKAFCSVGVKTLTFEQLGGDWKIVASRCSGCDESSACP